MSPIDVDEAAAERRELRVEPAGDDEHRHVEAVQAVPQRVLGAGAGLAQRLGQPLDGVLRARLPELHLGAEPGEQRLGQPGVDEGLDAVALDPLRHRLVLLLALGPLVGVVDAAGGADEDEALDQLGVGQGEVQQEAGAHRVAEVGGATALVGDEAGAGAQPGVERASSGRGRGRRRGTPRGR